MRLSYLYIMKRYFFVFIHGGGGGGGVRRAGPGPVPPPHGPPPPPPGASLRGRHWPHPAAAWPPGNAATRRARPGAVPRAPTTTPLVRAGTAAAPRRPLPPAPTNSAAAWPPGAPSCSLLLPMSANHTNSKGITRRQSSCSSSTRPTSWAAESCRTRAARRACRGLGPD